MSKRRLDLLRVVAGFLLLLTGREVWAALVRGAPLAARADVSDQNESRAILALGDRKAKSRSPALQERLLPRPPG